MRSRSGSSSSALRSVSWRRLISTSSSVCDLVAGEQIAERAGVVLADRLVEAGHRPRRRLDLAHLLQRQLRRLRQLLVGRLAAELGDQLALGARDLLLALDDVHRDPDRPRLVRDAALDGLADPPGRIGGELEALAVVELLDRPDQPDDPLLDQVEQRQAVPLVALGDRDDQPQVRVDHQILGFLVAALDPLGELDLLLGGQQLVAAGLVQEQLQRVGGRVRELVVVEGGVVLDDLPAVVAEARSPARRAARRHARARRRRDRAPG